MRSQSWDAGYGKGTVAVFQNKYIPAEKNCLLYLLSKISSVKEAVLFGRTILFHFSFAQILINSLRKKSTKFDENAWKSFVASFTEIILSWFPLFNLHEGSLWKRCVIEWPKPCPLPNGRKTLFTRVARYLRRTVHPVGPCGEIILRLPDVSSHTGIQWWHSVF